MTDTLLPPGAARPIGLGAVMALLGITQIIGYGTVYYAFALIAPAVAGDFGVDPAAPFVALSVALLLSGLVSPLVGRIVDRLGAARIMMVGSLAVAAAYGLIAIAPSFALFAVLIVLLQILSVAVLYGASFPTLARFGGERARRAITLLTLIAGFASTLYWPLTGWLVAQLDWRATFGCFALMHLLIAFPLHAWIAARTPAHTAEQADTAAGATASPEQIAPLDRRFAFWAVAASFTLTGIFSTALVVHLVPILEHAGLGANTYLVSMLIGPAMVGIRLLEAVLARWTTPLRVTILATLCFPLAALILVSGLPVLPGAIVFALLYGFGHGLNVIVSGTLPLALFGRHGYGELLGRLNAIRVVLSAGAPTAFAFGLNSIGFVPSLLIGSAVGIVALLPLFALAHRLKRAAGAPPAGALKGAL